MNLMKTTATTDELLSRLAALEALRHETVLELAAANIRCDRLAHENGRLREQAIARMADLNEAIDLGLRETRRADRLAAELAEALRLGRGER